MASSEWLSVKKCQQIEVMEFGRYACDSDEN